MLFKFIRFFVSFVLMLGVCCEKLILIIDDSNQKHSQYVKYINSSAQFLVNNKLNVVSVSSTNATLDHLCLEVDSPETFILSLTEKQQMIDDVEKFSNTTGIPTIQILNELWFYSSKAQEPFLQHHSNNYVTFISPENVFLNVYPPLISEINVTNCYFLYDESYVPDDKLKFVLSKLSLQKLNFGPMQKNSSSILNQMNTLKDDLYNNIFLMGSMVNVQEYATKAKQEFDINYFKWYIITMDTTPYICDMCTLTDTLWVRPDIDTTFAMFDKLQDYIVDTLEHKDWIIIPDQIHLSFYFDLTSIVWNTLSFMTNSSQSEVPHNYTCTSHSTFTVPTDLSTFITQSGNPKGRYGDYSLDSSGNYFSNIKVVMSYIYEDKKFRHIKTVASWNVTSDIDIFYGSLDVNVTSMKNFSIVISVAPPFIEADKDNDGKTIYSGYCIDLIEYLKEELGFDYTMYAVKDSLYGSLNERGEWNGLIRDLINGHADLAVADLSVTAERENYVDFTVPYYDLVGVTILMKKEEVEYSLFKFMTVLTPPVWLCIVAAYFFTSFVMWLFDKYSPYGPKEEAKFTFTQCLWYCMTALTPQGGPEAPKNISCKLVAATWWLFGFIIIASYTANLAAFLTVSRMESTISGLDDLSQQYKIKYAPVRGTASEAYFKRMATIEQRFYDIWKAVSMNESMTPQERASLAVWDYPVSDKYTNMWRFMQANSLPNSSAEAINMVLNSESSDSGFAYIGDATGIRYATMIDCRLRMVGGEFNRKPYAIAVQQLSPLKDILSGTILKLSSDRKLEDLKDKWWKNNPHKKNCPEEEAESSGISVKNIAGVFLVILGGIVFSIVTLIFEYFCIRNKEVSPETEMKKEKKPKRTNSKVMTVKTLNAT